MPVPHNFLPDQYKETNRLPINHNYLPEQFADYADILEKVKAVVLRGDFTLGEAVDAFERRICELTGSTFCLGVGSGTDALFLSLKALGVDPGDEVITTPYTFYATIGAIVTAGARPVFVDVGADYNIDTSAIEAAISPRTKAILPVHWSGGACAMDEICALAQAQGLAVVEDACHGIMASYQGRALGTFGDTGCFSMHPLKNLNVWGDGGYLVTNREDLHSSLSLLRNHGLVDRDTCHRFAYNSRLDTLQAVVALHLLEKVPQITQSRIQHAERYDAALAAVSGVTLPPRHPEAVHVYHIYVIRAEGRDELVAHLISKGIDAKVHYPIPMHLQPAAAEYGHKPGDFPQAEAICDSVLSLPVHEFITDAQIDYVCNEIGDFYAG